MTGPLAGDEHAAVARRGSRRPIIASADSRQAKVVAQRFAELLARGADPGEIIAFPFTERAAQGLNTWISAWVACGWPARRSVSSARPLPGSSVLTASARFGTSVLQNCNHGVYVVGAVTTLRSVASVTTACEEDATQRFQSGASARERTGRNDAEYGQFTAARLRARRDARPHRRRTLRLEIDHIDDAQDRHVALQGPMQQACRPRDAFPEALGEALAACREQIALAPRVAASMRRRHASRLPAPAGYGQLAIILELQKACAEGAELTEQAGAAGWDDDWETRVERLRRRRQP